MDKLTLVICGNFNQYLDYCRLHGVNHLDRKRVRYAHDDDALRRAFRPGRVQIALYGSFDRSPAFLSDTYDMLRGRGVTLVA